MTKSSPNNHSMAKHRASNEDVIAHHPSITIIKETTLTSALVLVPSFLGLGQYRRHHRRFIPSNGQWPMAPLLMLPPPSSCCSHPNEPASPSPAILSAIIPHVLSYMDAITLSRASSTCRSWNTPNESGTNCARRNSAYWQVS
eukprot:scaffold10485_cov106-Skeletonema_dohrnii-CCMP3373.AAC.7